ncbi:hypothetical protein [Salinibacterium sp.]|uniref:hypothetical protein n=1 Tax=Salinibacterium sp. TaxID=1915057 RepID=UPI00286BCD93|nr:hypothetical protein [Salinibacterium sp.]
MAGKKPASEIPPVPVPPHEMVAGFETPAVVPDATIPPPLPAPVEPAPLAASPAAAPPVPLPVAAEPAIASLGAEHPNPYATPGQSPAYGAPSPPSADVPTAYGPPTGQPNPSAVAAAGPPQTLSIISMICGIAGLLGALIGLGFLLALAGVITGHIAQRRQPWAKGFWVTGLITGYVGVAIGLATGLFVIIAILIGISASS